MSALWFLDQARRHPLARRAPLRALGNIARWQLRSRLAPGPHREAWLGGTCLVARRGMTGATGNIYYGLHEFFDMGFLLHFLREGDLFADVGANIGSYSILASGVCGAHSIAFEPDPVTLGCLRDNLAANALEDRVTLIDKAVGREEGELSFSVGLDTVNHVLEEGLPPGASRQVAVTTLDTALAGCDPAMIKIDVEGYEDAVIEGAHAVLAAPSLRAIEIETLSPAVARALAGAGFEQYGYDPFRRELSRRPGRAGNNHLYVRDFARVAERLREAPAFEALGMRI